MNARIVTVHALQVTADGAWHTVKVSADRSKLVKLSDTMGRQLDKWDRMTTDDIDPEDVTTDLIDKLQIP